MSVFSIRVKKLHELARLPERSHEDDSGADIFALEDAVLTPGFIQKLRTGLAFEIKKGLEGQLRPRSSQSDAHIEVRLGTIDAGYRGEVKVPLLLDYHPDRKPYYIKAGDKIAQLVVARVTYPKFCWAEALSSTARGTGGFGSTGR